MSWPTALLGEVANLASGGTPDRARPEFYGGSIPWITSADIVNNELATPRSWLTQLGIEKSAASVARPGTVLLVTRTGVGKVCLTDQPVSFNQDITAIRADDSIVDRCYLAAFLRSQGTGLKA